MFDMTSEESMIELKRANFIESEYAIHLGVPRAACSCILAAKDCCEQFVLPRPTSERFCIKTIAGLCMVALLAKN